MPKVAIIFKFCALIYYHIESAEPITIKIIMKRILFSLMIIGLISCNEDEEPNVYTGNQLIYDLVQSSQFPVSGTATFVERRDGLVELRIALNGTEGNIEHPAHLHYGDVAAPDAEVARLLTPVNGETGISVSEFNRLTDESEITFNDLSDFNGHIKVHLDGDANKSVILASGNIGVAYTKNASGSRQEIAICKSE